MNGQQQQTYQQRGDIGLVGNSVPAGSPRLNGLHLASYSNLKSRPQDKLEVQGQEVLKRSLSCVWAAYQQPASL